jgi:phytoene/squalene synthetase
VTEDGAKSARRITWRESKQSYLTMRFLVDRDLVDDSYRAYAYFRWVDDVVDDLSNSKAERLAFIWRQGALITALYNGLRPVILRNEETLMVDLIRNDRGKNSRLKSYIENFLAIIEFDADRKGRSITDTELETYSDRLALAVTDAIQYFIKNGHPYPEDEHRLSAARAAHVIHMLRDMRRDLLNGYSNIPREYLERNGIEAGDIGSRPFLNWVQTRIEAAREDFRLGKAYIDRLDVLRVKIAAYWYCARFERILHKIEMDEYNLRLDYSTKHNVLAWSKMAWIAARLTIRHASFKLGMANRLSIGPFKKGIFHTPKFLVHHPTSKNAKR